jgi:ornithine racemase
MIELGELREGVLPKNIFSFYKKIFSLSNIKVIGLGTNLGCLYGVEPTYDKLIQLALYKKLLEEKFNKKLIFISGGSSITLPLIDKINFPKEVNHFRVGEAVFFGTSPLTGKRYKNLSTDNFEFEANILELELKNSVPEGKLSEGNIGHFVKNKKNKPSYRALLDFGLIDIDHTNLIPKNKNINFVGITSDMCIYDLGNSKKDLYKYKYFVGGHVRFNLSYMGVARLLNSNFVEIKWI